MRKIEIFIDETKIVRWGGLFFIPNHINKDLLDITSVCWEWKDEDKCLPGESVIRIVQEPKNECQK